MNKKRESLAHLKDETTWVIVLEEDDEDNVVLYPLTGPTQYFETRKKVRWFKRACGVPGKIRKAAILVEFV